MTENDLIAKGCRAYMGWDETHEVSDDVISSQVGQGVTRIVKMLTREITPECLTHEEAFVLRETLMNNRRSLPERVKRKLEVISRNGGREGDCDLDREAASVLISALNEDPVSPDDLNRAMDMLDDIADLAATSEREKELTRKLESAYDELDRLEERIEGLVMPLDEQLAFGVSSYQELAEVNLRQAEHISSRLDESGKLVGRLAAHVTQVADTLDWKGKELVPVTQEKLEPVPEELPAG